MALRGAVPKTSPNSSVLLRSPIHKQRLLPTPPKSALPQLLIPLRFKSFVRNGYRKPQGGRLFSAPKFSNSPLPTIRSCGPHTNALQIQSYHGFTSHFPVHPRFGVVHRQSARLGSVAPVLPAFQFPQFRPTPAENPAHTAPPSPRKIPLSGAYCYAFRRLKERMMQKRSSLLAAVLILVLAPFAHAQQRGTLP